LDILPILSLFWGITTLLDLLTLGDDVLFGNYQQQLSYNDRVKEWHGLLSLSKSIADV
jgi:hypothetical protein